MNPYIDINGIDRSQEVEDAFKPTLVDIKNDPELYAELVNDLIWYWVHNTRETELMDIVKRDMLNRNLIK